MKNVRPALVVKREDVTGDLFKLWLKPQGEEQFTFKAGQYCAIGFYGKDGEVALDKEGKELWRPYSIVSAPHEKEIELFVELVRPEDGGNLTPLLYNLKDGDAVPILPKAKGIFTFEEKYKNQVMVATVTGIAPFMSMIRSHSALEKTGHHFFALHGASYRDEFGYDKELEEFARKGWDFNYVPTVSRPREERNKGWGRQTGRVNEIVEEYLARWCLPQHNTIIYACGHPGMVEDVKQRLGSKEWKVKEERYWK